MQVAMIMHNSKGLYRLINDQGDCLKWKSSIIFDKKVFKIVIQFFHYYVWILREFFQGKYSREMAGTHELKHNLELFLD